MKQGIDILQIPDCILPELITQDETPASIHFYENPTGVSRSKVALTTFLFSFVTSGEKQITHISKQAKVSQQEFLLLKPSHCLMTEKIASNQGYQSILFFFKPEAFINLDIAKSNSSEAKHPEEDFLVLPVDDYLTHFLHSLQLLKTSGISLSGDIAYAKSLELLNYLVRKQGNHIGQFLLGSVHSTVEDRVRLITEQNLERKLSIEELAFLSHLSVSTFKRKFKELYRETPSKWFLKHRLLHAKRQMTFMGKSPSEVYWEAGFETHSSFSQAFKKQFGYLPSQSKAH